MAGPLTTQAFKLVFNQLQQRNRQEAIQQSKDQQTIIDLIENIVEEGGDVPKDLLGNIKNSEIKKALEAFTVSPGAQFIKRQKAAESRNLQVQQSRLIQALQAANQVQSTTRGPSGEVTSPDALGPVFQPQTPVQQAESLEELFSRSPSTAQAILGSQGLTARSGAVTAETGRAGLPIRRREVAVSERRVATGEAAESRLSARQLKELPRLERETLVREQQARTAARGAATGELAEERLSEAQFIQEEQFGQRLDLDERELEAEKAKTEVASGRLKETVRQFNEEFPLRELKAETDKLQAATARLKAEQLPEKLKNELLISQNNLAQTVERGKQLIQQGKKDVIDLEIARTKAEIERAKLVLQEETNIIQKQILSKMINISESTQGELQKKSDKLSTTTTKIGIGAGGLTVSQTTKPFEARVGATEDKAVAMFDRLFRDLDPDERLVVQSTVLAEQAFIQASGQPLTDLQSKTIGFTDLGIKMLNDISVMFSPAFVGPITGSKAVVAFRQMLDLTSDQENQLFQTISRASKIAARADTGAQASFAELVDIVRDFVQKKDAPGVFVSKMKAVGRQLVQRRDSVINQVKLTRGNAAEAKFAQPRFDISVPSGEGTQTTTGFNALSSRATKQQMSNRIDFLMTPAGGNLSESQAVIQVQLEIQPEFR